MTQSHRPNTLLSVPGKVFAHILLAHLEPLLHRKRHPQQSGFTKNRSTLDAVLALRMLSEIHREFQKPLYVAYVYLKAAFDSVDRAALWKALCGAGLPDFLVDLLRALDDGATSRARHGSKLSRSFLTTSGVQQGCVLAPALFCRTVDMIMSQVADVTGLNPGDIRLTDLN